MEHRAKYLSLKSSLGITLHDGDSRSVLVTPQSVDRRLLLADASTVRAGDRIDDTLAQNIAEILHDIRAGLEPNHLSTVHDACTDERVDLSKSIFRRRETFDAESLKERLKSHGLSTKIFPSAKPSDDDLINRSQPIPLCEVAEDIGGRVISGGKALDTDSALRSALAEAVERVVAKSADGNIFPDSASTLREVHKLAVPHFDIGPRDAYSEKLILDWVMAQTANGKQAALPAERAFYSYVPRYGISGFEWQFTSGLAAGTSTTDAFSAALREVMERDAYWAVMRCRLRCPIVDASRALSGYPSLLTAIHQSSLDIILRDISLDWPIKIVHAVCVDTSGRLPAFAHGTGSGDTLAEAALAATLESLQLHAGLVRRSEKAPNEVLFARAGRSPDVAWSDPTARADLDHLLSRDADDFAVPVNGSSDSLLSVVVDRVESTIGRIFWCDLGKMYGLKVVRVFVENAILPYPTIDHIPRRLRIWLDRAHLRYPYSVPIMT